MATVEPSKSWIPLPYEEWAETKKTLQLYTQIAGKIRLALGPHKPEWTGASLYLTARGLTTGPMPTGSTSLEVTFDFFDHTLSVLKSDGRARIIPLVPARCVADVYRDVTGAVREFSVAADIWPKPQEVPDTTPLHENRHNRTYEPDKALSFFRVLTAVSNVLDAWSSRLFARTSVQFWWGSFDLSVLLFNGKHASPPDGANYIMRYDLDAEFMTAGFWPGDDDAPVPGFYGYINPPPEGCPQAPVRPAYAGWSDKMSEWMMPYADVIAGGRPECDLTDFLDSILETCGKLGGWDLGNLVYAVPPKVERVPAIGR